MPLPVSPNWNTFWVSAWISVSQVAILTNLNKCLLPLWKTFERPFIFRLIDHFCFSGQPGKHGNLSHGHGNNQNLRHLSKFFNKRQNLIALPLNRGWPRWLKNRLQPWLVCSVGWAPAYKPKGHWFNSLQGHAWLTGQVPGRGPARGSKSMFLSHINISFPLFVSPFPSV